MQSTTRWLLVAAVFMAVTTTNTVMAGKTCSNKFAENAIVATTATDKCKQAAQRIGTDVEGLAGCYRQTGLYFSDLEQTCQDSCLPQTIAGAKYMAASCPISSSELSDPPSVYYKWTNEQAVRAACAKTKSGGYCLGQFSAAMVQAETLELSKTETHMVAKYGLDKKNWPEELGCNMKCAKDLYDAVNGDHELVPVKYLSGSGSLRTLFKSWEIHCFFKRKETGENVRSQYPPLADAPAADPTTTTTNDTAAAADNYGDDTTPVPQYSEEGKEEKPASDAYPEKEPQYPEEGKEEKPASDAYPETEPQYSEEGKPANDAYPETKSQYPDA